MEFGVLGALEIRHGDRRLPTGSARERFLLATLLLHHDHPVAPDSVVTALWATPPRSARSQVHNMISNIRSRLHHIDDRLVLTHPAGYELRLGRHRLDLVEFRSLAAEARRELARGDHAAAVALLDEALRLWRGTVLADVPDRLIADVRRGLEQELLAVAEAQLDAELSLGRVDDVLRGVAPLLAQHPYAENLYRRQMLALEGAGRRAEALDVYATAYRRLTEDLGVEPGAPLRQLQQQILRGQAVVNVAAHHVVPRQLPPLGVAITGRDDLLRRIGRSLRPADPAVAPVVALVGPGGVGKTMLALTAAHQLSGHYPDGQLYGDLRGGHAAPVEPHLLVGQFLRALGVAGRAVPTDPQERVAMYRSIVAGRRILVVLDDAGDEAQLRPLLPGSPSCGTIVTSRRRLAGMLGTCRLTVPHLGTRDGVALLAQLGGTERVDADPATAHRIVELCGGLPLAVGVAAAQLAVHPQWTLARFEELLAAQRNRLDALHAGDLGVRSAIALSHRALSPGARQLFRRLGQVSGPDWPVWVADVVADAAHVDELADVHLIEPVGVDRFGQERYRLHDLVDDFARERLAGEETLDERTAGHRQLLMHWLALATEADRRITGTDAAPPATSADGMAYGRARHAAQTEPLAWFESERAALIASVGHACRTGLPELAAQLVLRMAGFLGLRCYDDDRVTIVTEAIACVREHGHDHLLAPLLDVLFLAHLQQDQYRKLPDVAAEALAAAERAGQPAELARAHHRAGLAAERLGDYHRARALLERAVVLARRVPDGRQRVADAQATLAFVHLYSGEPELALAAIQDVIAHLTASCGPLKEGIQLYHYGLLLTAAGDLDTARGALLRSRRTCDDLADDLGVACVEQALADIDLRQGRTADAAARLHHAHSLHQRLGSVDGLAETHRAAGDLACVEGRWSDAIAALEEAAELWRRIGAAGNVASTLARLEQAALRSGDPTTAADYRRQWTAILDDLNLNTKALRLPAFLAPPGEQSTGSGPTKSPSAPVRRRPTTAPPARHR